MNSKTNSKKNNVPRGLIARVKQKSGLSATTVGVILGVYDAREIPIPESTQQRIWEIAGEVGEEMLLEKTNELELFRKAVERRLGAVTA